MRVNVRHLWPLLLVVGVPARQAGWACMCAHLLDDALRCPNCGRAYVTTETGLAPTA